jgi:hypothetical protein
MTPALNPVLAVTDEVGTCRQEFSTQTRLPLIFR